MIAHTLLYMYTHQLCRVKWCKSFSTPFGVGNGVEQSGVASPLLFSMYLDILLKRLQHSGVGCHIDNTYVDSFAYADLFS